MSTSRHARRPRPGLWGLALEKDGIVDAMAPPIGHGLAAQLPKLLFLPVAPARGPGPSTPSCGAPGRPALPFCPGSRSILEETIGGDRYGASRVGDTSGL